MLSFITLIYQRWPVYGRTAGAVGSFSGMERIYWPLRQLRYTSRSLAPFSWPVFSLEHKGPLCVSLSFGWQLWVKHSSTDLHICNFEEVGATPVCRFFTHSFFLILEILEMRHAKHRLGRLIIRAVYLHGFSPRHAAVPFQKSAKITGRLKVEGWRTVTVYQTVCTILMDSLYITVPHV